MGCAFVYSSGLAPDIDFDTLVLMRSFQSAALAFLFVPISTVTYLTLPREFRGDGAALFLDVPQCVRLDRDFAVDPRW